MTKLLDLPAALEAAGVNVRVLPGWNTFARPGYDWRENDGEPAGEMAHHTASTAYTPNRDKANGYAGLSYNNSQRLYQERYEGDGYEAVYTVANAYPAPISSGAGNIGVLEKVRRGVEVVGRPGPDTTNWYGNTHYHNTEWVLNGTGAPIDQEVWDMMVLVSQVLNDLMGWTRANHIAHGHHTRRKIDLWGGQFSSTNRDGYDLTLLALRDAMDGAVVIPPPIDPPPDGDEYMFPTLREGDGFINGPNPQYRAAVKAEQIMLAYHEFKDEKSTDGTCSADGARGPGTVTASKAFQSAKGLTSDGVCGPKTWEELNKEKS